MFQYIEIEQKPNFSFFKLVIWGASAFFGVITYLKHFPMNYSLLNVDWLNIDWLFIVNGGKVVVVAVATGYMGSLAKKLGDHHWEKIIKYFKDRKNKTPKK